ncbi:ww domain-binding protein 11 [Holotrichia oblita]|uniref:Ww domain-binding protein 11 n=1 Tax=Holotrichia oblita TaxID=644536 RepID=A0ACB9TWN0_HOLOL|nr:ww domain-binding protein 11 [Holotrichia oblita]
MGRRSINTTKSGKYMNPTDQARKEARKQELKKNKKQRQMVRAAVLKGKDPQQLLEEMEKIDQMEYNVHQPSPLNEKVLKDKRKKLRDTLDRVLSMYHKDDPDKWIELKRKQAEYEHKKNQLVAFYESVKSAQQVTVDEIPLPQLPQIPQNPSLQIPLPVETRKAPEHPIYSIATALKLQALGKPIREPPGCPPGPAPDINSDGEVEERESNETEEQSTQPESELNNQDEEEKESNAPVKPTSLQQKMVAISGQNVDEFMKEMEVVQKKMETDKEEEIQPPKSKPSVNIEPPAPPGIEPEPISKPPPQQNMSVPPLVMFPAPGPMRVPPGPPPGRPLLPPGPPPGLPPRLPLRMPHPPARMIRIPGPPPPNLAQLGTPNVLSAGPQLINRMDGTKSSATIMAKPQIRNLSADVTRFVPSALRVKREDKKPKPSRASLINELRQKDITTQNLQKQPTKDDAYLQFMKEMQGLL